MQEKQVAIIFLGIFIVALVLSLLLAVAIPHIGNILSENKTVSQETEPHNNRIIVTEILCDNGLGIIELAGITDDIG